jgi:4,5-DOPA dioxygenase extradiol
LRDDGVLVLGSGNIVHNLGRLDWGRPEGGFDWADRFDESALEAMTGSPSDLLQLQDHPDFHLAVPTPDHFIPSLYIAGLAAAAGEGADVLIEGRAMGGLSMTSYTLDAQRPPVEGDDAPAAPLPDPDVVPPEDTNA